MGWMVSTVWINYGVKYMMSLSEVKYILYLQTDGILNKYRIAGGSVDYGGGRGVF